MIAERFPQQLEGGVRRTDDELILQTRSMMGVMNALAQRVEAPREHVVSGQVRESTAERSDEPGDVWLRVKHARLPAANPFVQVHYNGYC